MNYKYKISVVMAVYNVEPFLKEAIDSIIKQDIGLKNIQLILVDDGSLDNSGIICDEYATLYPDNVVVVHKGNGGVSAARNTGLEYVQGKYVNFCDADDKFSKSSFSKVFNFFEANNEKTDVVSVPLKYFDAKSGEHILNYKFKEGNRIINLDKEWQNPQLHISSSFIKREKIENFKFDTNLKFAEDAQLLQKVLSFKRTLGLVKSATYHYRSRSSGEESALQSSLSRKEYYLDYKYFPFGLVEFFGNKLPLYAQYAIMYDLQWRIKQKNIPEEILSEDELHQYYQVLHNVLMYIDDEIIRTQKQLNRAYKYFAYQLKYDYKVDVDELDNDVNLSFNNKTIFKISDSPVKIEFLTIKEDVCKIEGTIAFLSGPLSNEEVYIKANGVFIRCNAYEIKNPLQALGRTIEKYLTFDCDVNLADADRVWLSVYTKIGEKYSELGNMSFGKYSPIGKEFKNSYYSADNFIVTARWKSILIEKKKNAMENEKNFLKELWRSNKEGSKKAVVVRALAHFLDRYKKKGIWLISDKANRADDNGEAFFIYMCNRKEKDIKPVFLIEKASSDFKKLKKYGTVIPYMSWRHKLLYLISEFTISAYSHDEINNPFIGHHAPYRDLLQKCKFIFLQHGVTKDDMSLSLNRYHKNINAFICAAKGEYESITTNPKYSYSKEVFLTGFSRYDRLYHNEEKEIVIMPTWRRELFGSYHSKNSLWDIKPGFKESSYYRFYTGLLNSDKLITTAKELEYKINFVPHPIFFPYLEHFSIPADIKMWDADVVYRDMFAKNMLLITDFSSVAFDFAYLRKPIIYAHFDSNHYEEGYFNYEENGFGEVEYTLQDTIDRIIEYMKNDCLLKEKYRERIDNFFAFNDKENCQRIFNVIRSLAE